MKLEDFSLRQVAIGIPALVFAYWAAMQFVILPHMSEEHRRHIYPDNFGAHYLQAISIAFMVFAAWFVFRYKGRFATHGRKLVVFAMALGSLCGMLLQFAIRSYWHI
jgi:hypothetical protein